MFLNFCSSSEEDFASVAAIDQHRVGKHAYTYSEGVKMTPMREDGRRCLHPSDVGVTLDGRGRWHDAKKAATARTRFAATAS